LTEGQYHASSWQYPAANFAAFTPVLKEFEFRSRNDTTRFVVTTDELPAWVEPTLSAFSSIKSLDENWDSYGGKKISNDLIRLALSTLSQVMGGNSPAPSVVPLPDGGLQVEWHRKIQDLEVVFPANTAPTFYYVNRSTGFEKEGFANDVIYLSKLLGSVA
jgi:hypothetical protein